MKIYDTLADIPNVITEDCEIRTDGYSVHIEGCAVHLYGNGIVASTTENSCVETYENSCVEAYENSYVEAYENSCVIAYDNSYVEAYDNSRVEAYDIVSVNYCSENCVVNLYNNAVCVCKTKEHQITAFGNAYIQMLKEQSFIEGHGIEIKDNKIIIYKRVSSEFKTQEGTKNETLWEIGSTVTHPKWHPEGSECGGGKFHGVAKPYIADEFRNVIGDKYIAIEVNVSDLYEYKNASYPHKIAFREGKVLYECDRYGNEW